MSGSPVFVSIPCSTPSMRKKQQKLHGKTNTMQFNYIPDDEFRSMQGRLHNKTKISERNSYVQIFIGLVDLIIIYFDAWTIRMHEMSSQPSEGYLF